MRSGRKGGGPAAPHRPEIAGISEGPRRPLWSVMIPTYNCARYLGETLESVLAQDPGPEVMQIEVVDDHSTADDPESVVRAVGQGRVAFHRQPRNVGHVGNFNTCLRRARGHLVHILHGDDLVRPGFYRTFEQVFSRRPEVGAVFCNQLIVDEEGRIVHTSTPVEPESGILDRWMERIAQGQRLQTPSIAARRSVYEKIGGFDSRLSYCEDWEMWVRIAAHYPVWYEPEPLAVYRIHLSSNSGRQARTGANIQDLRRGVAINRELLPASQANRISRQAYRNIALGALRRARRILKGGNRETALAQIREAFRTSLSPLVFLSAARIAIVWAVKYAWIPRSRRKATH
jgi:glycosyltransferase involved in cell wall biosynthesis